MAKSERGIHRKCSGCPSCESVQTYPCEDTDCTDLFEWSDGFVGKASAKYIFFRYTCAGEEPCNWKGTPLRAIQPQSRPTERIWVPTQEQLAKIDYEMLEDSLNRHRLIKYEKGTPDLNLFSEFVFVNNNKQYVNYRGTCLANVARDKWPKKIAHITTKRAMQTEAQGIPTGVREFYNSVKEATQALGTLNRVLEAAKDIGNSIVGWWKDHFDIVLGMVTHLARSFYESTLVKEHLQSRFWAAELATLAARFSIGAARGAVDVLDALRNGPRGQAAAFDQQKLPVNEFESQSFSDTLPVQLVKTFISAGGMKSAMTDHDLLRFQRQLSIFSQSKNLGLQLINAIELVISWVSAKWRTGWKPVPIEISEMFAVAEREEVTISVKTKAVAIWERHQTIIENDPVWKDKYIEHRDRFKEWKTEVARHNYIEAGVKINPIVICFQGQPGTGKSYARDLLFQRVYSILGEKFDASNVYQKPAQSEYWDGYDVSIHKVVNIDDLGVVHDPEGLLTGVDELTRVATTASAPLNHADLVGKGNTFFNSEIVFVTTNMDFSKSNAAINKLFTSPLAFYRRLDFVATIDSFEGEYAIRWRNEPPRLKGADLHIPPLSKRGTLTELANEIAAKLLERRADYEMRKINRGTPKFTDVQQAEVQLYRENMIHPNENASQSKLFFRDLVKTPKKKLGALIALWGLNVENPDEHVKEMRKTLNEWCRVKNMQPQLPYPWFGGAPDDHFSELEYNEPEPVVEEVSEMEPQFDDVAAAWFKRMGNSVLKLVGASTVMVIVWKMIKKLLQCFVSKVSGFFDVKTGTARVPASDIPEYVEYPGEVTPTCRASDHSHECPNGHFYSHNDGSSCPTCTLSESLNESTREKVKMLSQSVSSAVQKKSKIVAQDKEVSIQSVSNATQKRPKIVPQDGSNLSHYKKGHVGEVMKGVQRNSEYGGFMRMFTQDANTIACHKATQKNCFQIFVDNGLSMQGMVVGGTLAMTAAHLFPQESQRDFSYRIETTQVRGVRGVLKRDDIFYIPNQDVCFFHLPSSVPRFRSIEHHFCDQLASSFESGYMSTSTFEQETSWVLLRQLLDIQPVSVTERWSADIAGVNKEIVVSRAYSAYAKTEKGDCGSPIYVCDPNVPRKILGIHVAYNRAENRTRFCVVTQDDIQSAKEFFHHKNMVAQSSTNTIDLKHCILRVNRGPYDHYAIKFELDGKSLYADVAPQSPGSRTLIWKMRDYRPSEDHSVFYHDPTITPEEIYQRMKDAPPHHWSLINTCDYPTYRVYTGEELLFSRSIPTSVYRAFVKGTRFACQSDGSDSEYESANELFEPNDEVAIPVDELPFEHFDWIGPGPKITRGSDTAIKKSPIHGVYAVTSYPAVLRPAVLDGVKIDPLIKDMQKADKPNHNFEEKNVAVAQNNWLELFKRCEIENREIIRPYKKKIWSLHEGINGLKDEHGITSDWALPVNFSSSAGYPYMTYSKGKEAVLEHGVNGMFFTKAAQEEYDRSLTLMRQGETPNFLFVPCLKDELRPLEKVQSLTTRVFIVGNAVFNILVRQYFGAFIARIMALHNSFEVNVGINVHGEEATRFAHRMRMNDPNRRYIAGDYKAWDKYLTKQMGLWFIDLANMWYEGTDEENAIRRLIGELVFNGDYIIDGNIYRITGTMPSGIAFTAVANSVINGILLRVVMCLITLNDVGSTPKQAMDMILTGEIVLAEYGDDHMISFDPLKIPCLTMESICTVLADYSLVYTHPDKKSELPPHFVLEEVEYLKRTFHQKMDGTWKMRLRMTVIQDIANWQKKQLTAKEAIESNYRAIATELLHYPQCVFNEMLLNYRDAAAEQGFWLPEYDFERFGAQIAETATLLGYTTMAEKMLGLIEHYVKEERHHIMEYFPSPGGTKLTWCYAYVNGAQGKCRGGTMRSHHECSLCSRTCLHLDENEPRVCLECMGHGPVPAWYFHDDSTCMHCSPEKTRTEIPQDRERDLFESILLGKSQEIMDTTDLRDTKFFAMPKASDWPPFAVNRPFAWNRDRFNKPLILDCRHPFNICFPFTIEIYREIYRQMRRAKEVDVIIAMPLCVMAAEFLENKGFEPRFAIINTVDCYHDKQYVETKEYVFINFVKHAPTPYENQRDAAGTIVAWRQKVEPTKENTAKFFEECYDGLPTKYGIINTSLSVDKALWKHIPFKGFLASVLDEHKQSLTNDRPELFSSARFGTPINYKVLQEQDWWINPPFTANIMIRLVADLEATDFHDVVIVVPEQGFYFIPTIAAKLNIVSETKVSGFQRHQYNDFPLVFKLLHCIKLNLN